MRSIRVSRPYTTGQHLAHQAGRQIIERALKKGTVGGDVGMQLLFEPAMLLSLVADGDVLYELAEAAGAFRSSATTACGRRASRSCAIPTLVDVAYAVSPLAHEAWGRPAGWRMGWRTRGFGRPIAAKDFVKNTPELYELWSATGFEPATNLTPSRTTSSRSPPAHQQWTAFAR